MLKAPPLQTATATIETLCGRLQSATLLEDRRSAIMGLRSFAKQYPASVASGSLRELISILRRDGLGQSSDLKSMDGQNHGNGGDVDTVRLVLETLLMLFNPDSSSPEASDEITLFMADEFAMRQDNVALLLSFLDQTSPVADYYSRLYSIQLLSAICPARPERLQECILGAPLGISRLAGTLDDGRDAVRNAGLLLLVDLTTNASDDLKKLVAFEDVFGKVFNLIQAEGGLGEAGITAQDCLSLLANLIRSSSSNQTMFRESGCVTAMQNLLQHAIPTGSMEAAFVAQNREKATWGLLQLLSIFFVSGSSGTTQNQLAFFRVGTAQTLIDMGFAETLPLPIRTLALDNASALINGNAPLQEAFAGMAVSAAPSLVEDTKTSHPNGERSATPLIGPNGTRSSERSRTFVIEGLLDLALKQVQEEPILRAAATNLIEAYLQGHSRIKPHFLQRAIAGHTEHEVAANVLTNLLEPSSDNEALVFASRVVSELVDDSSDAKFELAKIKEGNESEGEDVLTSIQTFASHLQDAVQDLGDERRFAAYCGLLAVLLWDFPEGINDFLAEGSGILQALVAAAGSDSHPPLLTGLSAVILGIVYEFSTKDSPIPRRTLSTVLDEKLGRGRYLKALSDLRRAPAIRNFDVAEISDTNPLLSKSFIGLFTVEYTRLRKAIEKDPRLEVVSTSALEIGVDRDVLDELRVQLSNSRDELAQAQQNATATAQEHEKQRVSMDKELHSAKGEVERLRRINESIQQEHEKDNDKVLKGHEKQIQQIRIEHSRLLADARQEEKRQAQAAAQEQSREYTEKTKDIERRLAELGNVHRSEQQAHATTRQQYDALLNKHNQVSAREASLAKELGGLTAQNAKLQREHQEAQGRANRSAEELKALRQRADELESRVEQLSNQKLELEKELAARHDELAAERLGFANLEKEIASAKTTIATLRKQENTAKDTKDKLEALGKELATVKTQNSTAEQDSRTAQATIANLEKELAIVRKKLATQEKELTAAQNRAKSLEKEASASKDKSGTDKSNVSKLQKELKAKDDELKSERNKVSSLSKEVSIAKQALSAAQATKKDQKASKEDAARVQRLEKELAEVRTAEKTAKEELESMLLVMSDIESKRDEYRARVKELGGDVSDPDGSEAEEDEDEDEDEDDEDEDANVAANDNDDVD